MASEQPIINVYTSNGEEDKKSSTKIVISIIIFIWAFLGIAGFIMSLVCFGRSGTSAQHIIGLLISLFLGPFYWIFYFAVPDYCKRLFS
jgi:flagellar basal body-associated protein FliL